MSIVEQVKQVTQDLYQIKNPMIDWNDWVFRGHNEVVAYWVRDLAKRYEFDVEAVEMAAYLHDIAYAWTSKNDPTLDEQSSAKAKEILTTLGLLEERTTLIVDRIIAGHGMHQGQDENLAIEAKVFSTSDAIAHFIDQEGQTSDFYLVICWNHYLFENKPLSDFREWATKKLERDFTTKIYFEPEREFVRPHYEALKRVLAGSI